ncbi:MAG TPA: hypothetical protein VHX38_25900 [Pseudonocardiaceae bacterium]|jgi:hypothetical protein|nr:hypothetical protein [Pseudonocardiaceae bacterium]
MSTQPVISQPDLPSTDAALSLIRSLIGRYYNLLELLSETDIAAIAQDLIALVDMLDAALEKGRPFPAVWEANR